MAPSVAYKVFHFYHIPDVPTAESDIAENAQKLGKKRQLLYHTQENVIMLNLSRTPG